MLADLGKDFAELKDALELGLVPNRAVFRVISILFPSLRITAGGLNVSMWARTDPHVGPGGRDDDLSDPIDRFGIGDAASLLVQIEEPLAGAPPPNAG